MAITDFTIPTGPRTVNGFTFNVDSVSHKGVMVTVNTSGLKHPDGIFQFVNPSGNVLDGSVTEKTVDTPLGGTETIAVYDMKYDASAWLEAALSHAASRFAVK